MFTLFIACYAMLITIAGLLYLFAEYAVVLIIVFGAASVYLMNSGWIAVLGLTVYCSAVYLLFKFIRSYMKLLNLVCLSFIHNSLILGFSIYAQLTLISNTVLLVVLGLKSGFIGVIIYSIFHALFIYLLGMTWIEAGISSTIAHWYRFSKAKSIFQIFSNFIFSLKCFSNLAVGSLESLLPCAFCKFSVILSKYIGERIVKQFGFVGSVIGNCIISSQSIYEKFTSYTIILISNYDLDFTRAKEYAEEFLLHSSRSNHIPVFFQDCAMSYLLILTLSSTITIAAFPFYHYLKAMQLIKSGQLAWSAFLFLFNFHLVNIFVISMRTLIVIRSEDRRNGFSSEEIPAE
jgi:hypothetical protein